MAKIDECLKKPALQQSAVDREGLDRPSPHLEPVTHLEELPRRIQSFEGPLRRTIEITEPTVVFAAENFACEACQAHGLLLVPTPMQAADRDFALREECLRDQMLPADLTLAITQGCCPASCYRVARVIHSFPAILTTNFTTCRRQGSRVPLTRVELFNQDGTPFD